MKESVRNEPIAIQISESIRDRVNALRSKIAEIKQPKLSKTVDLEHLRDLQARLNELEELKQKIFSIYVENYSKHNQDIVPPPNA